MSGTTQCTVDIEPTVTTAAVGELVTLTGGPFTADFDTQVLVGGVRAEVVDVERTDCTLCDACVASADCSACGECGDCDETCAECVEITTFLVPDVASGAQPVSLINAYGTSPPVSLDVTGGDTGGDTDTADTATADTGTTDTDGGTGRERSRRDRPVPTVVRAELPVCYEAP